MTSSIMVHIGEDEERSMDVHRSLNGGVSIGFGGDFCIFCKPEQALRYATEILQGVLALPPQTKEEQEKQNEEAERFMEGESDETV